MDGQLSAAHRSRQLLDLVDQDWLVDSLGEDDLHLPEIVEPPEEVDDGAAVLTDREGACWSLTVSKHAQSSLASSQSGLAPPPPQASFLAPGPGSNSSAVESADGTRWTDLALAGFTAAAQKQPTS